MGGRMSREKGKRGERELAHEMARLFGYSIGEDGAPRRGVQYQGGPESPDVVLPLPLHVECKRTEQFNAYKALEQAKADAPAGVPAIVCHRRNGQKWIVVVEFDSLADVAQRIATHIATRK